jgi:amidase
MIPKNIENVLMGGAIPELLALYRDKQLTVVEAVTWYLSRIQSISQTGLAINAVREVSACALEDARLADMAMANGRALGPLHGIPVLLKDNILTNDGMKAAAGAAALANFQPHIDATLVQKLRSAGAIVLGKTNLTEFADFVSDVMPSGYSGNGGVVKNPHGIEYGRGQGSSVGSAAAVAASLCMFAIGSETQNSIQTPASYSSVVGYKPTVGVVSRFGVVPLVPSQDSPGPLTRSVADAVLVGSVLAGADMRDSISLSVQGVMPGSIQCDSLAGIRVGVLRRQIADRPEFSDVMPLFESTLQKISQAGACVIDPCDLPSAEQLQEVRSSVFRTEFKASLNTFLKEHGYPCGIRSMSDLISWNEAHPEHIPYGQSLLVAANATAGLDDPTYIQDRLRDIALTRTAGIDAALSMYDVDVLIAPMGAAAKLTGKSGAPVVAIPCGVTSGGIPFGITVISKFGDDARLLAIAEQIESVVGKRHIPLG